MTIGINALQMSVREKSGIEFLVENTIRAFVSVTAETDDRIILYVREMLNEEFPDHVVVRRLRWPLRVLWTQGRLGWELVKHPPDVFIDLSNFLPLLSLFSRSKTFYYAHDYSSWAFPHRYTLSRLLIMRMGNRFSGWHAKGIFTPTDYTRNEVKRYFPQWSQKTVTVGAGVKRSFLEALATVSLPKSVPESVPYFLFVGRIGDKVDKRKNLDNLLLGFYVWNSSQSNRYQLVLAGRDDGDRRRLEELCRSAGIERVTFTGFVDEQELANLYAHASGVVLPTFGEGFGLPIVEGLVSGKPVMVSTKTGGVSGALRDHLVFCEPDREGIVRGLAALVSRPPQDRLKWETYEDVVRKMYAVMV